MEPGERCLGKAVGARLMFRLEEALQDWRAAFRVRRSITDEQLAELESHIEETFHAGIAQGDAPEQAFTRAVAAIGTHAELEKEYRKLKSPKQQLFEVSRAIYIAFVLFIIGFSAVFSIKTGYGPQMLNRFGQFQSFTLVELVLAVSAFMAPLTAMLIAFSYLKSKTARFASVGILILFITSSFSVIGPSSWVMTTIYTPTVVLLVSFFVTRKRLAYLVLSLVLLYLVYCWLVAFDAYAGMFERNPQLFAFNIGSLICDVLLGTFMAFGIAQGATSENRSSGSSSPLLSSN